MSLDIQVEPARRAYQELSVKAAITGRRRSQGADRAALEPIEVDSTGLVKVNPLCRWGFDEVREYVDMAGVPYNSLLDDGYKSVGDWHSTKVPAKGEDERAGRWAGNATKTECGLHVDYFKTFVSCFLRTAATIPDFASCIVNRKKAFEKKRREAELAKQDVARGDNLVLESSVQMSLLAL